MRDKTKEKIILSLAFTLLFISLYVTFSLLFNHGTKVDTLLNAVMIENYVEENELNLPFPNWIQTNDNDERINKLFSQDIFEFHQSVFINYEYSELYDCKYWSFVWANWYKYNSHDWEMEIFRTENHIFNIFSNNEMYCIADQEILNCIDLK